MQEAVVGRIQRTARRLDPFALEQLYQTNYLELCRRADWVTSPPLSSPGGGTASYSQLYALLSVLNADTELDATLELGVGASTQLITQWAAARGKRSVHVDDDDAWLKTSLRTADPERSTGVLAPLVRTRVAGRDISWYDLPDDFSDQRFGLVLIDGPQAWNRATRYDRIGAASRVADLLADEFVIVIDDASRPGERLLTQLLSSELENRGVSFTTRLIIAGNSQTLLVTPGYRFAAYL